MDDWYDEDPYSMLPIRCTTGHIMQMRVNAITAGLAKGDETLEGLLERHAKLMCCRKTLMTSMAFQRLVELGMNKN